MRLIYFIFMVLILQSCAYLQVLPDDNVAEEAVEEIIRTASEVASQGAVSIDVDLTGRSPEN